MMRKSLKSRAWLELFIVDALEHDGLCGHSARISEEVYLELSEHLYRAEGNDGDYPWHGKVKLCPDIIAVIHSEIWEVVKGSLDSWI